MPPADILTLIPIGFFGALLIFVALELGRCSLKTDSLVITILIRILALLVSMTAAFVIRIAAAFIMHRIRIARAGT